MFTVTFWTALDKFNKHKPNEDRSNENRSNEDRSNEDRPNENRSNSNYYISIISYMWTTLLILIMITYGFFGYYKINLIQMGYITLALLFLIIFQVIIFINLRS